MSYFSRRNASGGLLLLVLFGSTSHEAFSQSWEYKENRIAVSADGNSAPDQGHHWKTGDPDDWGATPAALAILAKLKMRDKLVHYSYNNFIAAPPGPDEKNQMKIGVDGAVQRWGFAPGLFFDVTKDLNGAQDHLKAELAKSTVDDPLYFVHMGPAEFFYQVVKEVVDQGDGAALTHVYIVSHSGYNDDHLRRPSHHTLQQAIDYSGGLMKYQRIKDQNGHWDPEVLWNSERDFSPWHWMRDHRDPNVRWIYERMQAHSGGKADISDAGMLYWLLLGDANGSPAKFEALLGSGIPNSNVVDGETQLPGVARDLQAELAQAVQAGKLLIVEAEQFMLGGEWEKVESDDAFGGGYIQYAGPNKYDAVDAQQTIEVPLTIETPGSYTVKWFMRQPAAAEGDKSNDVWINFPDAVQMAKGRVTGFHKFYGRSKVVFGMNGVLEPDHYHSWLNVTFAEPGEYKLQLSGRSALLQIDRFVLYRDISFEEAQAFMKIDATKPRRHDK
ncbi:hypothetical protein [Allorhodopirellula heiligendammensis]|uniref:Uncharacterized protein n=1 Tax=Allorhodopirellula heiligendammensis TaxID=2714739 RepID=A0A5C6BUE8_9BACT|nr:hypothetical protein [Allorhodopirellula heiligendammensis]TWU15668.1 hypothetical protein Poly21_28650 [Allorhodopirellula heiligendammensis]